MGPIVKKGLVGTGMLIAFYLALKNYTGLTKDAGSLTTAGSTVIKNLQGR